MPRLIFLFLALGLLALTPTTSGLRHLSVSGSSTDSGWEMDPNG